MTITLQPEMKHPLKNKIKAAFLLLVFFLNTAAGFACSVGVDMGYNSHHHDHEKCASHEHNEMTGHNHHRFGLNETSSLKTADPKDDCCSNDVTNFALLDKSVTETSLNLAAPVFHLPLVLSFSSHSIDQPWTAFNSRLHFVRRSCFLNDTNIRISIRSFQI